MAICSAHSAVTKLGSILPLAQEFWTKLFLWILLWAGLAARLSRLSGEIGKTQHLCSLGLTQIWVRHYSASVWRRHSRVWRTLLPSLEGIQQDNSGSPPKHSLALDGESGLDISLFNLFWPDSFFNQECVRSFQNVCMRGQLLSLLRFFYHFSLKKKKSL